jgi:hypothetical protein
MKYLAAALIFVLALAGMLLPPVEPATPDTVPASQVPPVAICPLVEAGERHTNLSVLSSVNGSGRLSTFSAGEETGALDFRTGATGAVSVPAAEAGAVGVAGGLVEMPSETTAAAAVTIGPESRAAESCGDIPAGQTFLSGGSTLSGSSFEVQLINPYAGEATVNLTVSTETGIESNERFDAVRVPPLSSITLPLTEIIPGRERISVDIETIRGSVISFGRQTTNGESALWRAVPAGLEWWLPVPPGGPTKRMLIATPDAAEIEYQVDLYGPDGFVESHATGVIDPRGVALVPLAAITSEAVGTRVISTGPVVASLWVDSDFGLASTAGSPVDAPVWLLPGASGPARGSGSLVVLNAGIEPVTVSIRTLAETTIVRTLEVGAEDLLVENLVAADGYRVEASGPVVAMWSSQLNGAGTAALGIPIQDG